jgi:glycosyltransferase involved in cell wall biosynthesis
MRIAHVSLRYPPATGGVETYVHNIVERTRTAHPQLDVRVITSRLKNHAPAEELSPKSLIPDPMYVHRLHHAVTPLIAYPRLQALSYYLGHHQPDIIHAYSFWYQPADTAARYARKHGKRLIFHPMYYENKIRQKLQWRMYKRFIGWHTFAAADTVVVISPQEQRLIEQAGYPVRRFLLVPPGVDTSQFERKRLNPYLKQKITGPIILTVGRISPGKGLHDLLNVAPAIIAKQAHAQFVIVGEDFGAKRDLVKQSRALGIQNHVHWFGKLPDEELIAAYQHASVLVHPSYHEAFGIVLIEALASRLPVVARDVAAIPYVVPHNSAGILFRTNEELAHAVLTLLSDTSQQQKMGIAGQRYVQQNFTWEKSVRKILNLYGEQ